MQAGTEIIGRLCINTGYIRTDNGLKSENIYKFMLKYICRLFLQCIVSYDF